MRIDAIALSVFELESWAGPFDLVQEGAPGSERFRVSRRKPQGVETVHVLHVRTADGLEGVSTVGDARYTTMPREQLEALRHLALGEDALDRDLLWRKLAAAARHLFAPPGWHGAFDNCLWDLAGKATGRPVAALLGGARDAAPCYANVFGATPGALVEAAGAARAQGFGALKDHLHGTAAENVATLRELRRALGDEVALFHDAALAGYGFDEAVEVGRALEQLGYLWLEEPLPDRDLLGLQRLAATLAIPILAGETFMNDHELLGAWLATGATDLVRANARHGTTPVVALAGAAAHSGSTVELNGPGGLFGLVHAHLCCGLEATRWYEFFPGGTRDLRGRELGLTNPPLPEHGLIRPPDRPGWGAEWDWSWFRRRRAAEL